MQSSHEVLSINYLVVCGSWKYFVLVELDCAIVVHNEKVISVKSHDKIGAKVPFVGFAEDSN